VTPGAAAGPDRAAPAVRWVALAVATLAHALGSLSALAVAPLAPFILDALGLSRIEIGMLLPAVYLGGVVVSLPAGWVTEAMGVRTPLAAGLLLTAAAVGLATLAPSYPVLLALLVAAGSGFGLLNPTTGRAIYDWFPPRERGLAGGIKQAGLTLGGIVSALVLPPLALAFGWRPALATGAAGAVVGAGLVAGLYRDPREVRVPASQARPSLGELAPIAGRPGVVVVFACGLALGTVQSSVLAYLVLYAREAYALPSVAAARLLAVAHLGGVAGRLGGGVVSDRLFEGRRRPGLTINALVAASALALFALGGSLPASLAAPVALLAGIGAFGWVGLYFTLIAEIGGPRYAGLLTGLGVVFSWGGVLVGPPLFGLLLEAADSYRLPWLVLTALALAVALVLPRLRPLVQRD
jgi:predicted MFS family arabinose efflux permease